MTDKGYLPGSSIELDDGSRYELTFYDPIRLAQNMERTVALGIPCAALVNVIVVPEVTPAAIHAAVEHLVGQGYFRHLKPVTPSPASVSPNGS